MDDVVAWALSLRKYQDMGKSLIVTDSYYFTARVHALYTAEGQPYLSSLKSNQLHAIHSELLSKVTQPGEFAGAHNPIAQETIVNYFSFDRNVKRKTVTSNMFVIDKSVNQPKHRPPLWSE